MNSPVQKQLPLPAHPLAGELPSHPLEPSGEFAYNQTGLRVSTTSFFERGYLLFPKTATSIPETERLELESYVASARYRRHHNMYYQASFPQQLENRVCEIFSKHLLPLFRAALSKPELCIGQMATNILHKGDAVGIHRDGDDGPHVAATVVMHVPHAKAFKGGYFEYKPFLQSAHEDPWHRVNLPARGIMLIHPQLLHRVTKIEAGKRRCLAVQLNCAQ